MIEPENSDACLKTQYPWVVSFNFTDHSHFHERKRPQMCFSLQWNLDEKVGRFDCLHLEQDSLGLDFTLFCATNVYCQKDSKFFADFESPWQELCGRSAKKGTKFGWGLLCAWPLCRGGWRRRSTARTRTAWPAWCGRSSRGTTRLWGFCLIKRDWTWTAPALVARLLCILQRRLEVGYL